MLTELLLELNYLVSGVETTARHQENIPILVSNPPESICSSDVETFIPLLLADLPSYANRILRRRRTLDELQDQTSYIIVAGKPEFEPLALPQTQYTRAFQQYPTQVFFTTLEREYINQEIIERQNYHWLLLTKTSEGWAVFMLFSSFGSSQPDQPPSPARESNNSAIAEAIRLWLKDCQI